MLSSSTGRVLWRRAVLRRGKVHCLQPASVCVEQLLACALREIVDRVLGDAILEVGIDSA